MGPALAPALPRTWATEQSLQSDGFLEAKTRGSCPGHTCGGNPEGFYCSPRLSSLESATVNSRLTCAVGLCLLPRRTLTLRGPAPQRQEVWERQGWMWPPGNEATAGLVSSALLIPHFGVSCFCLM